MWMTFQEKVDWFFAPPEPEQFGEARSTLHMLRREVQDCFIGTVLPEDQVIAEAHINPHRLFATMMVLMAGIDLLAKMYAGSDDKGHVRSRFVEFSRKYVVVGRGDAEERAQALYLGLRNPLVHSFTLHSEEYTMRLVLFQADDAPVWLRRSDVKQVIVSIAGVFKGFVRAVNEYERDLRADTELQRRFETMFEKYGEIQFFLRAAVRP